MKATDLGQLVKDAGTKFWDDKGPRLGAALAYYTALSLSPLLLAVVAIAGLAFGAEAARGEIVEQFRDTIGTEAASFVEQMVLKSASQTNGIVAAVIALAVLFFCASGGFAGLQSALYTLWEGAGGKTEGGVLTAG